MASGKAKEPAKKEWIELYRAKGLIVIKEKIMRQSFKELQEAIRESWDTREVIKKRNWEVRPIFGEESEFFDIKYQKKRITRIGDFDNWYIEPKMSVNLQIYSLYKALGEDSSAYLYTVLKTFAEKNVLVFQYHMFEEGDTVFSLHEAENFPILFGEQGATCLRIYHNKTEIASLHTVLIKDVTFFPLFSISPFDPCYEESAIRNVFLMKTAAGEEYVSSDMAAERISELFEAYQGALAFQVEESNRIYSVKNNQMEHRVFEEFTGPKHTPEYLRRGRKERAAIDRTVRYEFCCQKDN